MRAESVIAWMLAGSLVSVVLGVAVAIVRARRTLPPPTRQATRYARPDAAPQ